MKYIVNEKCVDFESNRLIDANEKIKLEPLVSSFLKILVENAGNVVTRDKLIEEVWKGRIVNESSINRNVSILRKLLGTTTAGEKCIKTVPKKGYILPESIVEEFQPEFCDGKKLISTENQGSILLKPKMALLESGNAQVTTSDSTWLGIKLNVKCASNIHFNRYIAIFIMEIWKYNF